MTVTIRARQVPEWLIQVGDTVKVFPMEAPEGAYYGVVRSMPQATGDAWIIETEGEIVYQQTYNRIVRLQRAAVDRSGDSRG